MIKKELLKYKLAPQTKLYDAMQARWRPFLMFNQDSNLRSRVCNTDVYGLRFNNLKNKNRQNSIFDEIGKSKKIGVLLGNSMAFGEGASEDKMTITSQLSKISNYHFLNFCGRGFSGMQEIINYLLLSHKLKNVKNFLIISGLNDSFLPFYVPQSECDSYQLPILGYKLFNKHMQNASTGWKKKILQKITNFFFKGKINIRSLNRLNLFEQLLIKKSFLKIKEKDPYKRLDEMIKRNFFILSTISKFLNVKIDFILQPVGSWCEKKRSPEEKKLFNEENQIPQLSEIYSHVNRKKYLLVKKIIQRETKKYKMRFFDLNEFLNQKKFDNKWFFVSNFHVNDECNRIIAKEIKRKFLRK